MLSTSVKKLNIRRKYMNNTITSKKSKKRIAIISAIITIALSLSMISYQYSQHSAIQISEISKQNARTNAEIEAYDLGNSLTNKLGDVTSLLQVISSSKSVHEENVSRASAIFNEAQSATSDVVDFYMWLDKDGKIIWISNLNETAYGKYKGSDLSYRLYFSEPNRTHNVYYSSVVGSNDGVDRIYISYPILGINHNILRSAANYTFDSIHIKSNYYPSSLLAPKRGNFNGIVVAGIRTDLLGRFLESQISPSLKSQVGLTDNTGILLYSQDAQFVGKNIFGIKFQSFLQSTGTETAKIISSGFEQGEKGHTGSDDIILRDRRAVFVYTPIILRDKQFGVLYVIAPFAEASEVNFLVENQRNLSILIIIAIGVMAVAATLVILQWNRKLEKTVGERTAELRCANEQLTVNDKLQREFINIAAHELRTPVQPILGMTEILESELGDKREDIRLIARNARRLERLTQDILDVSKIESGSLSLNKQQMDLDEAISSAISECRGNPCKATWTGNADENDRVRIRYSPRKITLRADRGRIQQVISNLIGNALKFTSEGEVIVKSELLDGFVQVSVYDTGSGIDPEIVPRLFQKFATKSEKGTGLGLYISKRIVEAHDGKIWAENNSGGKGGATFTFMLPH